MDRKAYDAHRRLMDSKPAPMYPLPPQRIVPRWPVLVATFAAVGAWVVVLGEVAA